MKTGVLANIERLVQSPKCVACDEDTNFGGKGRYELCRQHNNWQTYLSLRFKRWMADSTIANTGVQWQKRDILALSAVTWPLMHRGMKLIESSPMLDGRVDIALRMVNGSEESDNWFMTEYVHAHHEWWRLLDGLIPRLHQEGIMQIQDISGLRSFSSSAVYRNFYQPLVIAGRNLWTKLCDELIKLNFPSQQGLFHKSR